ncbi:MAG: hypothetical protein ACFFFT_08615 [Candidatus Thorarchaeota archaeon]
MKTLYKEFNCPQCGGLRYINVNGICFDCYNKNTLITLEKKRKKQHNLNSSLESFNI